MTDKTHPYTEAQRQPAEWHLVWNKMAKICQIEWQGAD